MAEPGRISRQIYVGDAVAEPGRISRRPRSRIRYSHLGPTPHRRPAAVSKIMQLHTARWWQSWTCSSSMGSPAPLGAIGRFTRSSQWLKWKCALLTNAVCVGLLRACGKLEKWLSVAVSQGRSMLMVHWLSLAVRQTSNASAMAEPGRLIRESGVAGAMAEPGRASRQTCDAGARSGSSHWDCSVGWYIS